MNYTLDVEKRNAQETGIVEKWIFNEISDFHVTNNLSVDVMHDVLEGIRQYDLGLILHAHILEKLFTLEELNHRIKAFRYGENKNKPPEILNNHIKNCRLMMSASEMLSLVRHLPLILGHLVIDEELWDLLLQLHEIVEILISTQFDVNALGVLEVKIAEYLESLTAIFPGSLKPKHHFLTHYPRVLPVAGPFWLMTSIRFESKQRIN